MTESKQTLDDGTTIKITGVGDKSNASVSIYSGDYKDKDNHSAIHVNINTDTGSGSIVEHGENHSDATKIDTQCYLTSACMMHFQDTFNDNCRELRILRWFRDHYVSKADIEHYYEVAPSIVEGINSIPDSDLVYDYIFNSIVNPCINAIENGNFDFAYSRYKSGTIVLEQIFARKNPQRTLIKSI